MYSACICDTPLCTNTVKMNIEVCGQLGNGSKTLKFCISVFVIVRNMGSDFVGYIFNVILNECIRVAKFYSSTNSKQPIT